MSYDVIAAYGRLLGPTALRVLLKMKHDDEELAFENGAGYVGDEHVCGTRTFYALCRACAISQSMGHNNSIYWRINETGTELLKTRGLGPWGKL